jgi:putative ABC transport system substrate-binding protein
VRRREFITLLGGAAAMWPVVVRAQQRPIIGYLYSGAADTGAPWAAAFRKGLGELGYSEGHNVTIEYRWAQNEAERLPELAADLVARHVAVIVAPGIAAGVLAAKAATSTIPIIFRTGGDPVKLGLVASLNRPGGNVTGVNTLSLETGTKRLGFLRELAPAAKRFAVLVNSKDPNATPLIRELKDAASAVDLQLEFVSASSPTDIDAAFASFGRSRPDALLVTSQGLFINRRVQIVTHATRQGFPAIYPGREFAEIGGLMSYGSNAAEQFRQAGIYTSRIL